jgi:PAS domain S-box-containing protein
MGIELTRKGNIFFIRLLVTLVISYLTIFGPAQDRLPVWPYLFVAFYLSTNLLVARLPDSFFANRTIFYVLVFFDSCMIALGMYLSGRAGTEFYLVYFIIIGLASMSTSLRYLMINTTVFALLYGWLLYQKGMFSGDMAVSYSLRLPFMFIIALFFGYIVDTLLRDKDRSLRESEEKYRSLVESTDDSVYMVDRNCGYLSANNKLLNELGASASDTLNKKFGDFHSPEETRRFAGKVNQTFQGQEALRYEAYNSNVGRWFMLTLSPVKDPSTNEVKAVSVLSKDITERIHTERKLLKAYNELKKTQEQLIQSAKMSAIGRLASGVAHQIRNPLAIIVMGVEFLIDELPDKNPMLRECIDKIKEASNRTNKIMTDFFQFSRTSAFELKSIDLCSLLDDAIVLMAHRLIVSNVEIQKEYPGLPVGVHGDKNTLQQAFINLFANAVDAMPEGGKMRIGVYSERMEANHRAHEGKTGRKTNGHVTVVKIQDTGKGIPEDVLPKIFEPFFTTKYSGQGTGLGLSTAHAIVRRHKGRIDVNSVVGKGTTFTVKLHSAHNPIVEV